MMEQLQEAVINGIIGVLVVLVSLGFSGIRRVIEEKAEALKATKTAEELATARALALTAVQAVEQIYIDMHGEAKLNRAMSYLMNEAANRGFVISEAQARPLIEAAVHEMNETRNLLLDEVTKTE